MDGIIYLVLADCGEGQSEWLARDPKIAGDYQRLVADAADGQFQYRDGPMLPLEVRRLDRDGEWVNVTPQVHRHALALMQDRDDRGVIIADAAWAREAATLAPVGRSVSVAEAAE